MNESALQPNAAETGLYPIRTVSRLTGVNSVTLRAWERRYGLVTPHRTAKGHRLYTEQDIDRINRIVGLVNRGIPISQVEQHLQDRDAAGGAEAAGDTWRVPRERMLAAITRFDEAALDTAYNEALSLYPVDVVTEQLINPLLRELGERWREQPGGIAEEHFFGTYMRNKLGARLHHLAARHTRPRLLAACLPGEHHELGLLLFCLAASTHGIGFVILGADMPLDDLREALPRSQCDGVLLSGSIDIASDTVGRDLRRLVDAAGCPVFVGGYTAVAQQDLVARSGAVPLGTDTAVAIRRLTEILEQHDGEAHHHAHRV